MHWYRCPVLSMQRKNIAKVSFSTTQPRRYVTNAHDSTKLVKATAMNLTNKRIHRAAKTPKYTKSQLVSSNLPNILCIFSKIDRLSYQSQSDGNNRVLQFHKKGRPSTDSPVPINPRNTFLCRRTTTKSPNLWTKPSIRNPAQHWWEAPKKPPIIPTRNSTWGRKRNGKFSNFSFQSHTKATELKHPNTKRPPHSRIPGTGEKPEEIGSAHQGRRAWRTCPHLQRQQGETNSSATRIQGKEARIGRAD